MGELKTEVIKAIVDQIHREYAAALFYRQLYHWADLNLYPGTAKFFIVSLNQYFQSRLCYPNRQTAN